MSTRRSGRYGGHPCDYVPTLIRDFDPLPFKRPEDKEWLFGKTAATLFQFGE